jgi:hypothetical protein
MANLTARLMSGSIVQGQSTLVMAEVFSDEFTV